MEYKYWEMLMDTIAERQAGNYNNKFTLIIERKIFPPDAQIF